MMLQFMVLPILLLLFLSEIVKMDVDQIVLWELLVPIHQQ